MYGRIVFISEKLVDSYVKLVVKIGINWTFIDIFYIFLLIRTMCTYIFIVHILLCNKFNVFK